MKYTEQVLGEIQRGLHAWVSDVKSNNKVNLNNASVLSENVMRDILNILWGYNFENDNLTKSNAIAIDLIDNVQKIGIQITSNETPAKVKDCIKSFLTVYSHRNLTQLYILVIGKKRKYEQDQIDKLLDGKLKMSVDTLIPTKENAN